MNNNKQTKNWWIDSILMAGYLLSFYLDLTGVILHQWLGAVVTILAGVHLMLHWDWVKAVTARLFKANGWRNRFNFVLDLLIMLGAVVIAETGLVISTWFNLSLSNYATWLDIHVYSSIATLAVVVIKVGVHWRWVVSVSKKVFSGMKPPEAQPVLIPVRVGIDRETVNRRQFLATMGVVGLGSLLAVSNVFSEGQATVGESTMGMKTVVMDNDTGSSLQTLNVAPTTAVETAAPAITITTEDGPELAATSTPLTLAQNEANTSSLASVCVVRCNRRCSYPGHCRRYIDLNGNGKCDQGECS